MKFIEYFLEDVVNVVKRRNLYYSVFNNLFKPGRT